MGFERSKCERALRVCGDDAERATEWMFSHVADGGDGHAPVAAATKEEPQELQDAALAAAMIAEEEAEHDEAVRVRELFENRRLGTGNFSKLSVSHARHYQQDVPRELTRRASEAGEEQAAKLDGPVRGASWDGQQWRDARGEIVTKHNADVAGRANATKLESLDELPGDFGDLAGEGLSLPTPAFNKFKKELGMLESRRSRASSGLKEGEKKAPKQGKEYGVEHGGAGQFAGVRIVSVGAARNAGVQGWGRPGEA